MMSLLRFALLMCLLLSAKLTFAINFKPADLLPLRATNVCFTPGGLCTDEVVTAIGTAKQQILVQAYQFTSLPIADALIQAKARGVDVVMLLDKSQLYERSSMICHLLDKGIPILIDKKPAIAHNKVIIIDAIETLTGSFNWTDNAQYHNAENLLMIHDKALASSYIHNWHNREHQSVSLDPEQLGHLACHIDQPSR